MKRLLVLGAALLSLNALVAATPVIHLTDLFRAPDDPDDHFDLATDFALAKRGLIDLKCVLIDYPPESQPGNPDVGAVAQLQYLTGISPIVAVGQKKGVREPMNGLLLLKRLLEESPEPVVLHVLGANDTLALFNDLWPEVLRTRVKAIYMNSGVGVDTGRMDYNVWLSPEAYRKMFDVGCPLYWVPCFNHWEKQEWDEGRTPSGRFGGFWRLRHAPVFDAVRPGVLNYLLEALRARAEKETDLKPGSHWLNAVNAPVDPALKARFYGQTREMYCTVGFLHAAGLVVWKDGTLHPVGEAPERELFRFRPVSVTCNEQSRTTWKDVPADAARQFIVEILDVEAFPSAMTKAVVQLFSEL